MRKQDTTHRADSPEDRRAFLKRAGTSAVAVPAAALLLSSSAKIASAGSIGSTISGAGPIQDDSAPECWVAREVYGIDNPRWLEFRAWMRGQAPTRFRNAYLRHGPRIADWISDKPLLKRAIRAWVDRRIGAAA